MSGDEEVFAAQTSWSGSKNTAVQPQHSWRRSGGVREELCWQPADSAQPQTSTLEHFLPPICQNVSMWTNILIWSINPSSLWYLSQLVPPELAHCSFFPLLVQIQINNWSYGCALASFPVSPLLLYWQTVVWTQWPNLKQKYIYTLVLVSKDFLSLTTVCFFFWYHIR